jgi:cell division protein FtsW
LLAVIAEELGFVGVLAVVSMFAWIVIRSFSIAKECIVNERYFGALLAQGLGVWMGVQGTINMGVNMGLLPTKGLTLPLLSFGGSGILANCIAMAILLRVDYENRRLQKGLPA